MHVPKKWWWVVGIAVPLIAAVIAIVPDVIRKGGLGAGDTFYVAGTEFTGDVAFYNLTVVTEQVRRSRGAELPDSVVEVLRQATDLARSRQFDKAIPLLESVKDAAPVPALFNNLGAAYLATGNRGRAKNYFEKAIAASPDEQTARFNLSQATLLSDQTTHTTTSSSPAMRVSSQVPGVSAELIEFSRFENTITVKLRFNNSGEEYQNLHASTRYSYLLDELTHQKYVMFAESNPSEARVPAGGSLQVWAKYALPAGEKPQYVTAVFNYGILFEHIKVP